MPKIKKKAETAYNILCADWHHTAKHACCHVTVNSTAVGLILRQDVEVQLLHETHHFSNNS